MSFVKRQRIHQVPPEGSKSRAKQAAADENSPIEQSRYNVNVKLMGGEFNWCGWPLTKNEDGYTLSHDVSCVKSAFSVLKAVRERRLAYRFQGGLQQVHGNDVHLIPFFHSGLPLLRDMVVQQVIRCFIQTSGHRGI